MTGVLSSGRPKERNKHGLIESQLRMLDSDTATMPNVLGNHVTSFGHVLLPFFGILLDMWRKRAVPVPNVVAASRESHEQESHDISSTRGSEQ